MHLLCIFLSHYIDSGHLLHSGPSQQDLVTLWLDGFNLWHPSPRQLYCCSSTKFLFILLALPDASLVPMPIALSSLSKLQVGQVWHSHPRSANLCSECINFCLSGKNTAGSIPACAFFCGFLFGFSFGVFILFYLCFFVRLSILGPHPKFLSGYSRVCVQEKLLAFSSEQWGDGNKTHYPLCSSL